MDAKKLDSNLLIKFENKVMKIKELKIDDKDNPTLVVGETDA